MFIGDKLIAAQSKDFTFIASFAANRNGPLFVKTNISNKILLLRQ
jgi:hypothetical protein